MNARLRKHLRLVARSEWFDRYHIHPSVCGYRKRSLTLLCTIEDAVRSLLDKAFDEYQCFIAIDLSNSDYDAVYAHTRNGNNSPFPTPLERGRITRRPRVYAGIMTPLSRRGYTCHKLKGYPWIIAVFGRANTRQGSRGIRKQSRS